MLIYFFIIITFLFLIRKTSIRYYSVCVLLLFIIGAFRSYSVGTDTINYLYYFKDFSTSFDSELRVEPLFQFLTILVKRYGLSYRILLVLEMLLFLLPIAIGFRKTCKRPIYALLLLFLLGFYFSSFNISRQMIAVSFVFCAYCYLGKKDWIKGAVFILIGFLFHLSSIVSILALPFIFFDFRKKIVNILIIGSFLFAYIYDLSGLASEVISRVPLLNQYQYYATTLAFDGSKGLQLFTLFTNIIYLYLFNKQDNHWDIFAKITLFGLVFSNLMAFAPSYLSRLFVYFNIATIPYFVSFNVRRDRIIIVEYSILYFCYYTLYYGLDGVIPYKFM